MQRVDSLRMRGRATALLVLGAAVALAYANGLGGAFIFDDHRWIVDNPALRSFSLKLLDSGRPVLDATFAFSGMLHGLHAGGFRAGNVLIHLGAASVLFLLLEGTLALPVMRGRFAGGRGRAVALAASVIWAVHPLTTSAVSYICQRGEVLMGLCYLLVVLGLQRGAVASSPARRRAWFAAAVAAMAAGMGSKEVMITAPVLALIYDRVFLAGSWREVWRRRAAVHAGLCGGWLVLGFCMWWRARADEAAFYAWGGVKPLPYLYTQAEVVTHYLKLCVWPLSQCLDYRWPLVTDPVSVWPQLALLSAAAAATVGLLPFAPRAAFAGIWFLGILGPTSSLVPRPDFAFEHRMYLPLAGLVALVCVAVSALAQRLRAQRAAALTAVAAAAALAVLTHARNRAYADEITMWRDVAAKAPWNLRARNDLAVALSQAGRVEEATRVYAEVLEGIPAPDREALEQGRRRVTDVFDKDSWAYHYFRAQVNMGTLFATAGGDDRRAIRHFTAALRVAPLHGGVRARLAAALERSGCAPDAVQARIDALLASPEGTGGP